MKLAWDEVGDRIYETGVEKAVLYLPDGSAIPWNGLTAVEEQFPRDTTMAIYYDGVKSDDVLTSGDFSASLKALTYPDEFLEFEGVVDVGNGVFVHDQTMKLFNLSYQTKVGNDVEGDVYGYKIHILYNLTAVPSPMSYDTLSADPAAMEFEWTITTIPPEIAGYRATSHVVVDSRTVDPIFLAELEVALYGSATEDALLPPMSELVSESQAWYRISITDNGDGTWTAETPYDELIEMVTADTYVIHQANVTYVDTDSYIISDTRDISDIT